MSEKKGNNALALLMTTSKQSNKRKRSSSIGIGSRFVLCPAGCGQHFLETAMNQHLDKCIAEQETRQTHQEAKVVSQQAHSQKTASTQDSPTGDVSPEIVRNVGEEAQLPSQFSLKGDAISHIMKNAKLVFSQAEKSHTHQCLYLDEHGKASLYTNCSRLDALNQQQRVTWSAVVFLKNQVAYSLQSNDVSSHIKETVELTVSTSLPSHQSSLITRLVQKHSRLSVPVLKSILQKAIRRRQPLPAVRIAMELVDKSLGELLRRLPIIVLEDSTLHPDFALLVWLMIAHSKDFVLPPNLIVRLLRVVFEVASCQWVDSLDDASAHLTLDKPLTLSNVVSFKAPRDDVRDVVPLAWSILARADYGGMKGDIEMLYGYACLWHQRFSTNACPESMSEKLGMSNKLWSAVPQLIHQRSKEQSFQRIMALCTSGIDRITVSDACPQGVDYHCSPIVEYMLTKPEVTNICLDWLVLSSSRDTKIPETSQERRQWLESILKHCIWHYSSSVNRRRPLKGGAPKTETAHAILWNDVIEKHARDYQDMYIQQRLA